MIDNPEVPWRPSIIERQLRLALDNVPRERWLPAVARDECVFETAAAEFGGREFTRIYWWYGEDGVPVLTLWDMNESPEVALNKRYFIHAQL
jgi:hypothetical protein